MNQQSDLIDSLANAMNKQNSTLQTMINSLKNVMNEQNANVQIIVDSLAHVNNEQDSTFQTMSDSLENVMNEQDSTLQALIGSLAMNIGGDIMALGNLITQQQYYADSLNLDMGGYIDSLFALQQSMIVEYWKVESMHYSRIQRCSWSTMPRRSGTDRDCHSVVESDSPS
jgi:propanediol dehydratase large subunit